MLVDHNLPYQRLRRGVYLHSYHERLQDRPGLRPAEFDDGGFQWGVCDSPEQLLAAYDFDGDPRALVIALARFNRAEQGPEGWRWAKWGGYIGTQTPRAEYLADEPDIETVYAYEICEVAP